MKLTPFWFCTVLGWRGQIEFLCLFSDYLLFNDLREAGECGGDLLGIAATPLYFLLYWSRDRTNHVFVIRLETAAGKDVFLSPSSSPFPVRFSASFFFIAVFVFGALTFTGPYYVSIIFQ